MSSAQQEEKLTVTSNLGCIIIILMMVITWLFAGFPIALVPPYLDMSWIIYLFGNIIFLLVFLILLKRLRFRLAPSFIVVVLLYILFEICILFCLGGVYTPVGTCTHLAEHKYTPTDEIYSCDFFGIDGGTTASFYRIDGWPVMFRLND